MYRKTCKDRDSHEIPESDYRPFRHFYWLSLVSITIILFVAGLGLRHILRDLIILKAEEDAICVSRVARDCEIRPYIEQYHSESEGFLTIPPSELLEVDRKMRIFAAPFDIVKIKIYNAETRVIYSTDPQITGKLNSHNASLQTALAGTPISKYESRDNVWDLEDEECINVEIVETYVPMYGPDGRIIGSFEIYKDITRNLAIADRILVRSWSVLTVTVLGVFATLMFVIRRAVQIIRKGTANLKTTNEQLRQEIEDRERLERELLDIIERERQRIGQELHDSIGQQLTGIGFMAQKLGKRLSHKSLAEEIPYAERIGTCVGQAVEQTRALAKGLHPVDMDRNGLVSALHELAANTEQLFSISCLLKSERAVSINEVSVATNLYRITQEAITNAIKHGKAGKIRIELVVKDGCLKLMVENDGLDFSTERTHGKGMGLRVMHYRAEAINGSLEIRKRTNGGTIVTCVLPNGEHP
ncbi:sensor histidine kinase [Planctomycetota bacterium]